MARNEDVNTSIWEDEDFDELSDDAAFLYMWSFTNERCNMAGLYQVKSRHICEGRMTPARRTAAIEELAEARFLYYVDGWMWVRSRVKNLNTKGEKMAASIVKMVKRVPAGHRLRAAFLTEYLEDSWVSKWLVEAKFDTPSIPHRNPIDGLQGRGRGEGQGKASKPQSAKPDPDSLPADYPLHLASVVDSVMPILRRTAEFKGAKPVARLAVARAIESRPDRAHVQVASDLEGWCCFGKGEKKPAKDIVARYRTFLDNADVVAPPKPQRQPAPEVVP